MADPTRREILRLLSNGEMSAGDLAERFDMTKPTVSHHFTALKKADLIRSRRSKQQIIYSLNTTVLQDMMTKIYDIFGVGSQTGTPGEPEAATATESKKSNRESDSETPHEQPR